MKLYHIHKSTTGTPYVLMGTGSKLVLNRGKPKHSSGGALLLSPGLGATIPRVKTSSTPSNSLHNISTKLSQLSIKGNGSSLQRKKYISL